MGLAWPGVGAVGSGDPVSLWQAPWGTLSHRFWAEAHPGECDQQEVISKQFGAKPAELPAEKGGRRGLRGEDSATKLVAWVGHRGEGDMGR